jgi:predicted permease
MQVFSRIFALFLLISIGFILSKTKIAGPAARERFSVFIINVSLPALLIVNFQQPFSRELLGEGVGALFLSVLLYGLSMFIAFLYPRFLRIRGPERGVHRYALIFSNCGFIGYPMVLSLLGPDLIFHTIMFNSLFSFLAYSIGAWFISKEGKEALSLSWKTFFNPSVFATIIGFTFFIFSIKLPEPLYRCCQMLGDTTTPLSMVVIGITLSQATIKECFGKPVIYVTVAMRLIIMPALAILVCVLIKASPSLTALAVLLIAMPVASTASILASLYHVAAEEAGSLVFISTILSMLTIPLIMSALGRFI